MFIQSPSLPPSRPGITASGSPKPSGQSPALYPSLLNDYSVISLDEASNTQPSGNLNSLLPHALQMAEVLKASNVEGILKTSARGE